MPGLKRGDHFEWNTSQGAARGTVVRGVEAPMRVEGHVAEASPDHPQVEVRSEKSGAHAVHHARALRKVH